MTYTSILEQHQGLYAPRFEKLLFKIFQNMDEHKMSLQDLSAEDYAKTISKVIKGVTIGSAELRYAIKGLHLLYDETGAACPDEIKSLTFDQLSLLLFQHAENWRYYKTIEDVIANINTLRGGDFYAFAKAASVLAWHGISSKEMVELKKTDFDWEQRQLKIKNHATINFSAFEMKLLANYRDLQEYTVPYSKNVQLSLVQSEYLFRPRTRQEAKLKNQERMSDSSLRSKIQKMNGELKKIGRPVITLNTLLMNGDFYRIYTSNLSELLLPPTRRVPYNQYVLTCWNKEE